MKKGAPEIPAYATLVNALLRQRQGTVKGSDRWTAEQLKRFRDAVYQRMRVWPVRVKFKVGFDGLLAYKVIPKDGKPRRRPIVLREYRRIPPRLCLGAVAT